MQKPPTDPADHALQFAQTWADKLASYHPASLAQAKSSAFCSKPFFVTL